MLRNDKVFLRAVEPEDLDLMYLIENDTTLWAHGNTSVPFSYFALKQFIAETQNDIYKDGQLRLAICTSKGNVIGFCDLQNFSPLYLRAEIGIVILPEWQSKGYGKNTLNLLAEYAQHHLHLHQLYAVVSSNNESAIRLFQSVGYENKAELEMWLYPTAARLFQLIFDKGNNEK